MIPAPDQGFALRRDDALSADALAMIAESEAEQSAIYPPEVRYAFSPEQLRTAGVLFLTAYLGGRPVGCGGIALCEGYAEMKRIFVTRAARGQRIAVRIVAALEELALAGGHGVMRLETGQDSPEALALYRRLGYRRIGPFGAYVENGSSIFLEKSL